MYLLLILAIPKIQSVCSRPFLKKYFAQVMDEICDELKEGRMYRVESTIRKLLCRIFHYSKIMNASTNRGLTSVSLKKTLIENHFDEYRNSLIAIAELNEYSRERVSDAFKNMLEILFTQHSLTGQTVLDRLPSSFM